LQLAFMGTIYRKTRIGQDEIETRALRLLPRMRGLLIVVDGRRDEAELQALLGYEPSAALRELLAYGLIETVSARGASAPNAGPGTDARAGANNTAAAPMPVAAAAPGAFPSSTETRSTAPDAAVAPAFDPATFEQLRKVAVRALNDTLGPAAETAALRMERAATEAEWRAALEKAVSLIATVRGAAAGRAFAARFLPLG
jgi:hypothetical protein